MKLTFRFFFLLLILFSGESTRTGLSGDAITSPRYIRPWPVSVALGTGIPKAIKGSCTADRVFTIKSVDDLLTNINDLECIYAAGLPPNTIPLGPQYGTVLKFLTSETFTPIIATLWKGKLAMETRCPAPLTFAMNFVSNRLRIPSVLSIGVPQVTLAVGEYTDGKDALLIDYTQDFGDLCTSPPNSFYSQKDLSLNLLNNIFPFNLIVDVVRVVGRQEDNGAIYLGKTYLADPFRADNQSYNIAFWAIVNYDPRVTTLSPGESLPPLGNSFTYMEAGAFQLLKQLSPVDNLFDDPGLVLERFFEYFDAFTNVLVGNLKMDFRRGAKRGKEKSVSRIEFLISSMSSILSLHPLLTVDHHSKEFVAETLLLQPVTSIEGESLRGPLKSESKQPLKTLSERFVIPILSSFVENLTGSAKQAEQLFGSSDAGMKMQEVTDAVDSLTPLLELAEELRNVIQKRGGTSVSI